MPIGNNNDASYGLKEKKNPKFRLKKRTEEKKKKKPLVKNWIINHLRNFDDLRLLNIVSSDFIYIRMVIRIDRF